MAAMVLVALSWLASAGDENVAAGARVRLSTTDGDEVTGRIENISADAVVIALDGDSRSLSVPRPELKSVEISRGPRSRARGAWSKAKWGALIGAVPGAISLGLQHEQVGENGSSVGEAVALGAYSGGLFGGLIGAVIGAIHPGEKWERVTPVFQLGASGFSFGVTVGF